jgi:hypothetical protein
MSIKANEAMAEPKLTASPVVIFLLSGFLGTIISAPGSILG